MREHTNSRTHTKRAATLWAAQATTALGRRGRRAAFENLNIPLLTNNTEQLDIQINLLRQMRVENKANDYLTIERRTQTILF